MQRDDVLAYPHQIADALWRIEAAGIPRAAGAGGVTVCGVAYGAGELAAEMVGNPSGDDPFVLCISYSGDDEEALACFEEAGQRGASRAVVCTAGRLAARAREEGVPVIGVPAGIEDPRGAIIYFVLAAAVIAEPSLKADIEAAVPTLTRLAELSPEEARALDPAELLEGKPAAERALARLMLRDLAALSR
jgi:glucose/mannose-6-phosphate isomerase